MNSLDEVGGQLDHELRPEGEHLLQQLRVVDQRLEEPVMSHHVTVLDPTTRSPVDPQPHGRVGAVVVGEQLIGPAARFPPRVGRVVAAFPPLPVRPRVDGTIEVVIVSGACALLLGGSDGEAILVDAGAPAAVFFQDLRHGRGQRVGVQAQDRLGIESKDVPAAHADRNVAVNDPPPDGRFGNALDLPEGNAVRPLEVHDPGESFSRVHGRLASRQV